MGIVPDWLKNHGMIARGLENGIKSSAKDFSLQACNIDSTSKGLSDDKECDASYKGGIDISVSLEKELERTAEFIGNINEVLNMADLLVESNIAD